MHPQRIALLSVTDKAGICDFASKLVSLNFKILSTGGTAKLLKEQGIEHTDVATYTGSPEILDGRVKTLHPKVHGGILANRQNPHHLEELSKQGWPGIDLVIVNLYNFSGEVLAKKRTLAEAIEFIDVGGPTMLRGAAKNHRSCLPVIDPQDYDRVIQMIKDDFNDLVLRQELALKVFKATAAYDQMIAEFFSKEQTTNQSNVQIDLKTSGFSSEWEEFRTLRYGENAHQKALLLNQKNKPHEGLVDAEFLHGKELSYNNYLDLDAASSIVQDLYPIPATTIIKHTNPCGTAHGKHLSPLQLFQSALSGDPKCAFGGIVASNQAIDGETARQMIEIFLECVIAPAFSKEALEIFKTRKNLRVLRASFIQSQASKKSQLSVRSIQGGLLAQTIDELEEQESWTCVTQKKPDEKTLQELRFAMTVCKHVKSNAIVLSANGLTIGVGAGQMSRVDSTRFAIEKAREQGHRVSGAVLASDAFFPFRDSVDFAAKSGITAIVQPGGSIKDQESINAANEYGIIMMVTGRRHFKH